MSVSCPLCGKEIKENRNMKRHIKTHTDVKSKKKKGVPKCQGCGKVFSSNQKLFGHMQKYHGVQKLSSVNTQVTYLILSLLTSYKSIMIISKDACLR